MFEATDTTVKSILDSMGMSDLSLTVFIVLFLFIVAIAAIRTVAVVNRETRRLRRATLAALENNAIISSAVTGTND